MTEFFWERKMTDCKKEDDYTLLVTNKLPTGGILSRYFNFAAAQVVSVFVQEAKMSLGSGYSGAPAAVSTALTSQIQIQKFSEFDSTVEIELMHAKLKELGGNPPALSETLTGKLQKGLPKIS